MWSCSNCGKTNPDDAVECECGFRHQVSMEEMEMSAIKTDYNRTVDEPITNAGNPLLRLISFLFFPVGILLGMHYRSVGKTKEGNAYLFSGLTIPTVILAALAGLAGSEFVSWLLHS